MVEKIENLIKKAIKECDPSLEDVRILLKKALNELNYSSKKKKKNESITPFQKWQLDLSTGTLQNLSHNQQKNIINQIENMISNESNKISKQSPANLFND